VSFTTRGQAILRLKAFARYNKKLLTAYGAFTTEVDRFTDVINSELGP
jgi:hypothetical protein